MARDDWRKDRAMEQARWMQNECARCPVCGALVCGDAQKNDHRDFHIGLNNKLDNARDAIIALQARVAALEAPI